MIGGYDGESIHAQIYQWLFDVVPDLLTIDGMGMSEVHGMLPLHFEVVSRTATKLISCWATVALNLAVWSSIRK